MENADIVNAMFKVLQALVSLSAKRIAPFTNRVFSILVSIESSSLLSQDLRNALPDLSFKLALQSGYQGVADLYAHEVEAMLNNYHSKKTYIEWNKYSRERFKFDVMIRQSKDGLAKYLELILDIICHCVNPQADLEMRMDMLALVEFILGLKELHEDLKRFAGFMLSRVLITSTVWRIGKPNQKIRKAGMICMINLLEFNLITPEELHKNIKELFPVVKTCLSDDWAPDLRFVTCIFVNKLLTQLKEIVTDEELKDIYPSLLERLDDSQDPIRIEVTKAFKALLLCDHLRFSPSTYEYLIKSIFVHLDDQNEEVQMAVYHLLQSAATVDWKCVLEEAKQSVKKQKYPRKCQELIKLIEETYISQFQTIHNYAFKLYKHKHLKTFRLRNPEAGSQPLEPHIIKYGSS
eukprot:TRINITY_DN7397_c0_g1_i3.p1 TRINITY_DN7397_c0_g1~~TRINITY_DN7397_c0_g1_i3.p1  ORF type:complete len:407 (+),score=50.17 TRINITY_DN7397_c0_g1_i3:676-1896(+)